MILYYHKLLYLLPLALVTGPFLPDLIVVICSTLFLIDTIRLKLYQYYNNYFFKIFITFFLILNLSSFFSDNLISFKYSIGYLRYGIFSIFLFYIFKNFKNSIYIFSYILFLTFIFLIIDGYIQYFVGNNILLFNLEKYHTGLPYITSFFGEEKKLGSYLARLSPLFFISILFIGEKYNFKSNFLVFILILSLCNIILLTTERVSIFIIILFLLFIFLKTKYLITSKKIFFFIFSLFIILSLAINPALIEKIKSVFYSSGIMSPGLNELGNTKGGYDQGLFIYSKFYHDQIINSFEIFMNNIFFGIGPKSFKLFVSDAWHPHNYHAQILAEIGIFAYLILLSVFIIFFLEVIKFFFFKNINNIDNEKKFFIIFIIFINLLPIPSGDFFNNWLNIIIYLPFGYLLYFNEKKK